MVRVVIEKDVPEPFEVAKMVTGQYFGEMSLLTNEARSASVYAHTDCQLLEINADVMKLVFNEDPSLMETMAQIVSERKLANQQMEESLSKKDLATQLSEFSSALLQKIKLTFS